MSSGEISAPLREGRRGGRRGASHVTGPRQLPWKQPRLRFPAVAAVSLAATLSHFGKVADVGFIAVLAWLVERTISTPATHFAHHALVQDDGIGHYTGNYGNLLFVWDVLFGTARITRRYPPLVGLVDDVAHGPERWQVQLLYPLVKTHRARSALAEDATIVG